MSQNNRSRSHNQSTRLALSGMLTALAVVLMLTGGLFPIMTYVSPLLAGLLLLPLMLEFGAQTAWLSWGAAAIITMLLGIDREAAFFYLFIGYYPIVKWRIDRLHGRYKKFFCKLGLFITSMGLMYTLLALVFRVDELIAEFGEMGIWMTVVFFAVLILCLMLYDFLLLPMMILYDQRIRPHLKLNR